MSAFQDRGYCNWRREACQPIPFPFGAGKRIEPVQSDHPRLHRCVFQSTRHAFTGLVPLRHAGHRLFASSTVLFFGCPWLGCPRRNHRSKEDIAEVRLMGDDAGTTCHIQPRGPSDAFRITRSTVLLTALNRLSNHRRPSQEESVKGIKRRVSYSEEQFKLAGILAPMRHAGRCLLSF